MYCIGLTGTIASGKSTIAHYFQHLGIDMISADQIARQLVTPGTTAFTCIINHFGHELLTSTGELNRKALRELIINDARQRQWLEQLLHPLIRKKIQQAVARCTSAYCIIEIPLLINKQDYPYLNRILLVLADKDTQIARIMTRDNATHDAACAILATTQHLDEQRKAIADDIIMNNTSIQDLNIQLTQLHTLYLRQALK